MSRGSCKVYPEVTLIAYLIDRVFGEFAFLKHPVVFMGDFIRWFEKHFYHDSVSRGVVLTLSLLFLIYAITYPLSIMINHPILLALIASMGIASKMLYESVKDIMIHPENIRYLVSRDTENLSESDINKAAIETYAENLSDGVIAPLLYLYLFGIVGLFIYKGINTLDSMVGYRNARYERFGKFSARLDDAANYLPSRITALMISLLFKSKKALLLHHRYGRYHDSPNAGHPIAAMALALGLKLGGDTSYFGRVKSKPFFGDGREDITKEDVKSALSLQVWVDGLVVGGLGVLSVFSVCFD